MARAHVQTDALTIAVQRYLPELQDDVAREKIAEPLEGLLERRRALFSHAADRQERAVRLLEPCITADEVGVLHELATDPGLSAWFGMLVENWTHEEGACIAETSVAAEPSRLLEAFRADMVTLVRDALIRTLAEILAELRQEGALAGRTPEERFADFHRGLYTEAGLCRIGQRFPAQVIQAYRLVRQRATAWQELLTRFMEDRERIAELLDAGTSPAEIPTISSIEQGKGDAHAGGRSVALVRVGAQTIVYKPRDGTADAGLGAFFEGLARITGVELRVPRVISGDGYGWCEFIESATDVPNHGDYAFQLGQLAAVEYLLGGSDLHYENILADTLGNPVIIDAETAMGTVLPRKVDYSEGAGSVLGRELITSSVAGSGLLPLRMNVPGRDGSLDIGAVGTLEAGDKSPFKNLIVNNPGRDDMYIGFQDVRVTSGNSNPRPGNQLDEALHFRDRVVDGLVCGLRAVHAVRSEVAALADEAFTGSRFRYVHCPTVFYAQLLRMCTHPELLEDEAGHLAVLARTELQNGLPVSAMPHEVRQMLDGDVPVFTVEATGVDLLGPDGTLLHPGFFADAPLTGVRDRVLGLSDEVIATQADICEAAFAANIPDGGETTPCLEQKPQRSAAPACGVVGTAVKAILARALPATNCIHPGTFWGPVVSAEDGAQWTLGTMGYDLYGGSPGIALVLSESANYCDIPEAAEMATGVLGPIKAQILGGSFTAGSVGIGGMSGMGGTLWAIAAHDRLTGAVKEGDVSRMVQELNANIRSDSPPDFTIGAAGALAAGNGIAAPKGKLVAPDAAPALEALAAVCLTALEASAADARAVVEGRIPQNRVYTGFAHGLAGMAAPLFRSAQLLRGVNPELSERLKSTGGLFLEALLGSISPDGAVPREIGAERQSWAWCHGSPGVLLGLVVTVQDGASVPEDVLNKLYVQSVRRGVGNNSSYCHGDLGTLEALRRHADLLGDKPARSRWTDEIRWRAGKTAVRPRSRQMDRYGSTDSLMLGRSGALHALLRLSDPNRFADVLTLGQ